MEQTKKWYASKGVWLGICTFSIGSIEIVRQLIESGDFTTLGILTAVAGVLKVVERVTGANKTVTL